MPVVRQSYAGAPPAGTGTRPGAGWRSWDPLHWRICTRQSGWPGCGRNIWIETYENDYGQYQQELLDPGSALHAFKPDASVLFAWFRDCRGI